MFVFHVGRRNLKRLLILSGMGQTHGESKRPRLRQAIVLPSVNEENIDDDLPSLLDLNDDCLYEILTMLPVMTLSSIASTCTRLKDIARKVFNIIHKNTFLEFELHADSMQKNYEVSNFLHVLRTFGDMIIKLNVTFGRSPQFDEANTIIAKWMCTYCTDKIEYLKLGRCRGPACNELVNGAVLFRNVRELDLLYCDSTVGQYLHVAKQLESIVIYGPKCVEHFSHTFPKLQSFRWNYSVFSNEIFRADSSAFEQFLRRHSNITAISMSSLKPCNVDQISQMNHLTTLDFSVVEREDTIWPLGRLRSLKSLTVTLYGDAERQLVRFLNHSESLNTIKKIKLIYYRLSISHEMMEAICRYKNLNTLELNEVNQMEDNHLIHLYNLRELRSLTVTQSWLISTDGMVGVIRNLPKLQLLNLRLCSVAFDRFTYRQLAEWYRHREHKLIIKNHSISFESITAQFKDENLLDYVECYQSKCKSQ